MARIAAPGIFCLEGEWGKNLRRRLSVEPQLSMLKEAEECGAVIHRDVATITDFQYYLDTWLSRGYGSYTLGYLAFHGERRTLSLPDGEEVTLDRLVEMVDGRGEDKVLYLGSCSVLTGQERHISEPLRTFCKDTGFKSLVGYTKSVDWLEAAAFDFLLLPQLLNGRHTNTLADRLQAKHGKLVQNLGLRIATRAKVQTWKRLRRRSHLERGLRNATALRRGDPAR